MTSNKCFQIQVHQQGSFYTSRSFVSSDGNGRMVVNGISTISLTRTTQEAQTCSKQWIKGSLVKFICETKSESKQDVLIMATCPSNFVQWTETMIFKLATFPCNHWVAGQINEVHESEKKLVRCPSLIIQRQNYHCVDCTCILEKYMKK